MIESELVDDYAFGLLPADQSQLFELFYLTTPQRRHSTLFAQALREFLSTLAPRVEP
jgi:hypothetical protein